MSYTLENCPFCGSAPILRGEGAYGFVECSNDLCYLNLHELIAEDAIIQWNTRAEKTECELAQEDGCDVINSVIQLQDENAQLRYLLAKCDPWAVDIDAIFHNDPVCACVCCGAEYVPGTDVLLAENHKPDCLWAECARRAALHTEQP